MQEERKDHPSFIIKSKKRVLLTQKWALSSTLFSLISDKSPNKFLHHKRGKMTKNVPTFTTKSCFLRPKLNVHCLTWKSFGQTKRAELRKYFDR